jgi:hypothetical protein
MRSVVRASGSDYSGLDCGSASPPRSASPAPPRGTLRGPSARLSGPRDDRLETELQQERSKGFWARLFGG